MFDKMIKYLNQEIELRNNLINASEIKLENEENPALFFALVIIQEEIMILKDIKETLLFNKENLCYLKK